MTCTSALQSQDLSPLRAGASTSILLMILTALLLWRAIGVPTASPFSALDEVQVLGEQHTPPLPKRLDLVPFSCRQSPADADLAQRCRALNSLGHE